MSRTTINHALRQRSGRESRCQNKAFLVFSTGHTADTSGGRRCSIKMRTKNRTFWPAYKPKPWSKQPLSETWQRQHHAAGTFYWFFRCIMDSAWLTVLIETVSFARRMRDCFHPQRWCWQWTSWVGGQSCPCCWDCCHVALRGGLPLPAVGPPGPAAAPAAAASGAGGVGRLKGLTSLSAPLQPAARLTVETATLQETANSFSLFLLWLHFKLIHQREKQKHGWKKTKSGMIGNWKEMQNQTAARFSPTKNHRLPRLMDFTFRAQLSE